MKNDILTRKTLREKLKMKAGTLRIAIKRGKLVECGRFSINISDPLNHEYLFNYCLKHNIEPSTLFTVSDATPKESQIIRYKEKKLKQDVETRELDKQLKNLDLLKKKAKIIPVDFVGQMFSTFVNSNVNGVITEGSKIIDTIIDEFEGDYETKLKYKKIYNKTVNETFKNNYKFSCDEIKNKADEYSLTNKW